MQKLTIEEVGMVEHVGEKHIPKLNIKAGGEWYCTFKQGLFDLFQVGKEMEVNVEVTQKGQYTNRKITEVAGEKTEKPSKGKSPEERVSIERQVSVKLAMETSPVEADLTGILKKAEAIYRWIHYEELPKEAKPKTVGDFLKRGEGKGYDKKALLEKLGILDVGEIPSKFQTFEKALEALDG